MPAILQAFFVYEKDVSKQLKISRHPDYLFRDPINRRVAYVAHSCLRDAEINSIDILFKL
jgi:hypothetical protein